MSEKEAARDVFPHDRVVFFSDAVFAIAITLLAIELRLPTQEMIEHVGAEAASREVVSLFIAYIVSFLVIALFWSGHMLTWKHVTRATGKLVWCSILQLMFVALMPFATHLYSEAFSSESAGRFAFYSAVLFGISFFSWLTRRMVVRQENLRERLGDVQVRWLLLRGLIPVLVFAASIPLAYALPIWMGGFVFLLIFPLTMLARRLCFRRPKPEPAA